MQYTSNVTNKVRYLHLLPHLSNPNKPKTFTSKTTSFPEPRTSTSMSHLLTHQGISSASFAMAISHLHSRLSETYIPRHLLPRSLGLFVRYPNRGRPWMLYLFRIAFLNVRLVTWSLTHEVFTLYKTCYMRIVISL